MAVWRNKPTEFAVGAALLAGLAWWVWPSPAADPSPPAQRAFCKAIENGRSAWKDADAGPAAGRSDSQRAIFAARNEATVRALANDVRRELPAVLVGSLNLRGQPHPGGAAAGWAGTLVSAKEIPLTGALAFAIRLPCDAELVEFVPAARDSDIFRALATVKTGAAVVFDGLFLAPREGFGGFRERSVTADGAMRRPEFDFHVTAIAARRG